MTIAQLVYASTASTENRPNVEEILTASRTRNDQLQVTGFLCFSNDRFLQVFEGSPVRLSALYARVASDRRHSNVEILGYQKVVRRRFSKWAMGYLANFGDPKGMLFNFSGQGDFDPYGMDFEGAIEFLSEAAHGAR
ncbi:MAG: BLUF domain-containing protein [Gammaproteobacteria bacterium]|nr:BLUF domain-containing protein [Gammaproteobacteria bacterium]